MNQIPNPTFPKINKRLIGIVASLIALIFIGYELIERTYLAGVEMHILHKLHILRGIGATLLVSSVVVWHFMREREHFFPQKLGLPLTLHELSFQRDQINWFIRLRWLAI